MFLYERNICFILENLLNLVSFSATFLWTSAQQYNKVVSTLTQLSSLTNINVETMGHRHWIDVIFSILFQRWNSVNKHTLAQLSFSTKFQRWNNIGSSTLIRYNSIDVVSTLFCQCWNYVDKCTSAQLSFSTKYQRWSNVDERWRSTLFQRWFNVDVFTG